MQPKVSLAYKIIYHSVPQLKAIPYQYEILKAYIPEEITLI